MSIAEDRHGEIVTQTAEASIAKLQAKLEECKDEDEMGALLGMKPGELDMAHEDVFTIRMAFKQIGAMFSSGAFLRLDPDQIEALGANAKAPNRILVERTAERVLVDLYERGNPDFVGKYFAQPGRAENVEPDRHVMEIRHYEDGSMLAQTQSLTPSNIAMRVHMLSLASSVAEAANEKEIAELTKAMEGAVAPLRNSADLTDRARAMIPSLMQAELLTIARGLTAASGEPITLPLADGAALIRIMGKQAKDGAWNEGTTVSVDGKPCATPAEFNAAMGVRPASSLDDALARLRKARGQNPEAQTPEATPAPRPARSRRA